MFYPIHIRPFEPSDKDYILSTWKRDYRANGDLKWVPQGAYYSYMNALCDGLLEATGAVVASNPVAPEHVFGWLCGTGRAVHYVFVRKDKRRLHIAQRLLEHIGYDANSEIIATHWTAVCERMPNIRYAPSGRNDVAA